MTPTELLKKLEGLGTIEPKALRKIRIQIEDPERTVKVSAVSYTHLTLPTICSV